MIITELWIPGRPQTKGSLDERHQDTPASKSWRRMMAGAIRDEVHRRHVAYRREPEFGEPGHTFGPVERIKLPYPGPVAVTAYWFLPREPTVRGAGDIDKLMRNLLDALSAPTERTTDASLCAGAIVDDNQVVGIPESWELHDPHNPGALVQVRTVDQAEIMAKHAGVRYLRERLTA